MHRKQTLPQQYRLFRPLIAVWIAISGLIAEAETGKDAYNVLFIAVDDLRPVLGCYGNTVVQTPHLDALAKEGLIFRRAYCQAASCLPSRTSVLTGLRVDTTNITSNRDGHFRERFLHLTTLPQLFKNHGYFCREFGKVFHEQDPVSWSVPKFLPKSDYAYPIYGKPETLALQKSLEVIAKPDIWWGYQEGRNNRWVRALSWEDPDVPDEVLFDGQLAEAVVETLREQAEERFFLAVGFFRPHLPFIAPKEYFDLYPAGTLTLPGNRTPAQDSLAFAHSNSAESRSYTDIAKEGPLTEEKQGELLRAYYASVTFVDAQLGKLLRELERLDLWDKTIVVVWSDHGYHFGEHGTWNKSTNFEEATRSTLILRVPGLDSGGRSSNGLVELIDLFPTLSELCGLTPPDGLEGFSFRPLLLEPDLPWKTAVFSQIKPRDVYGYTMRTQRYRYTEWIQAGSTIARELFDHQSDPHEAVNLALLPENEEALHSLKRRFDTGWQSAMPNVKQTY